MRDGWTRETLQPSVLLLTTLLARPSSGARLAAEACAAKWEETLARLHADFHGISSRVKAHTPCFPASLSPAVPEPVAHLRPHV